MKKYRYFINGMFFPTDNEEYEINIPSPFLYDSEEEAMKDEKFGYRFVLLDDAIGPQIVVFEKEDFVIVNENDTKYLKQWVEGQVLKIYTFEQFKEAGGYIRMLKPELKGKGYIDSCTDFLDTDKTFQDVYPNMLKGKLYYIDNQAYYVEEYPEIRQKGKIG